MAGLTGMRFAFVNTEIAGGGAAKIAASLAHATARAGHEVYFLSRGRVSLLSDKLETQRDTQITSTARLINMLRIATDKVRGHEDFNFPDTTRALEALGPLDVLHLHNLHGDFFDLEALPKLAMRQPTIFTLHDMWTLTGHCAHSFGCERWKSGCGKCPDLSIYPELWWDGTAFNWRRKKQIFGAIRPWIVTPSRWLYDKVNASPFFQGHLDQTLVIPNGIDTTQLQVLDKKSARASLGLPLDGIYLGLAATGIVNNPFKDFLTAKLAVERIEALQDGARLYVLVYGARPGELPISEKATYIAFDPGRSISSFYSSLDLFIHSTLAETSSLVLMESISCGVPVIASAVGGVPEVVGNSESNPGVLFEPRNVDQLAKLLNEFVTAMKSSSSERIGKPDLNRFALGTMVARYHDLYERVAPQRLSGSPLVK
jgi:glycosyltransferase involved in cell wall biosynthesis